MPSVEHALTARHQGYSRPPYPFNPTSVNKFIFFIQSDPIPSNSINAYLPQNSTKFNPFLSKPILSVPVQSYPIQSNPVPSQSNLPQPNPTQSHSIAFGEPGDIENPGPPRDLREPAGRAKTPRISSGSAFRPLATFRSSRRTRSRPRPSVCLDGQGRRNGGCLRRRGALKDYGRRGGRRGNTEWGICGGAVERDI